MARALALAAAGEGARRTSCPATGALSMKRPQTGASTGGGSPARAQKSSAARATALWSEWGSPRQQVQTAPTPSRPQAARRVALSASSNRGGARWSSWPSQITQIAPRWAEAIRSSLRRRRASRSGGQRVERWDRLPVVTQATATGRPARAAVAMAAPMARLSSSGCGTSANTPPRAPPHSASTPTTGALSA